MRSAKISCLGAPRQTKHKRAPLAAIAAPKESASLENGSKPKAGLATKATSRPGASARSRRAAASRLSGSSRTKPPEPCRAPPCGTAEPRRSAPVARWTDRRLLAGQGGNRSAVSRHEVHAARRRRGNAKLARSLTRWSRLSVAKLNPRRARSRVRTQADGVIQGNDIDGVTIDMSDGNITRRVAMHCDDSKNTFCCQSANYTGCRTFQCGQYEARKHRFRGNRPVFQAFVLEIVSEQHHSGSFGNARTAHGLENRTYPKERFSSKRTTGLISTALACCQSRKYAFPT